MHSPLEFSLVLKRRGVIRAEFFDFHHANVGMTHPRLGMVISKRFAKRAVLRNLIKRQIRESFRRCAETLPHEDFVFRLARPLKTLPIDHDEQCHRFALEVSGLLARASSGSAV